MKTRSHKRAPGLVSFAGLSALLFVLVLFGGETPGNRLPQLSPGGYAFLTIGAELQMDALFLSFPPSSPVLTKS